VISELARSVISALSEHGQTVATAESLTGGLVCSTLVGVPGSSVAVRGAIVAYATSLKHELLGVDDALLASNGPVDPEVAVQMARGVRTRLGADWGVATTGVAGPGPQDGVAAGIVFVAVASADVTRVRRLELSGDRFGVRAGSTDEALSLLLETVLSHSAGPLRSGAAVAEHDHPARR
jgi:nicotinamide-nucleotide amidase